MTNSCNKCPLIRHNQCSKVGGEIGEYGYCEDAFIIQQSAKRNSRRTHGRAYRREMTAKKRNRLLNLALSGYTDYFSLRVRWDLVEGYSQPIGKYAKLSKKSDIKTYWKNYSNRVIRRGACMGSGKGGYKKAFEYWWTIY